ncbi:MAG: hypothetical protein ACI4VK_01595, partial [Candidatus Coproplasma sp.]
CADVAFGLGIPVYALLPCDEEEYKESFNLNRLPLIEAGITSGEEWQSAVARDEEDKRKLDEYLFRIRRQGGEIIYAPDVECNKDWIKKSVETDDASYRYRQLGIYLAQQCHVIIALWDGRPPATQYGCGTAEVIGFALEGEYYDGDKLCRHVRADDSAVVWIKSRRQGDTPLNVQRKWLTGSLVGGEEGCHGYSAFDEPPTSIKETIAKIVARNDG